SRGKRQSKVTVCLNNLHHIGIAMEYFLQDNGSYPFPATLGGHEVAREFLCPSVTEEGRLNEPRWRPLYPYIKPSDTFLCPEDKGLDFSPDFLNYAPSCYYAFGCSYAYNYAPWKDTKHKPDGGLPLRNSSWVRDPSRYILC